MVSKQVIKDAISEMGLVSKTICLHSSLKSFGRLAEGPDAVIDAFVESGCTLVVPTFSYHSEVMRPVDKDYPQNGYDHEDAPATAYDPQSTMIARSMGAIPARLLEYPKRERGNHPLNSFSAIGPQAKQIIAKQSYLNVYGPLKEIYKGNDAYIVLAGVDLTKATPIHYAEERAGRNLFRRWAKTLTESLVEVEIGSCSEAFENFSPYLKDIERQVMVGESLWRVFPYKAFIDAISEVIKDNQQITSCHRPTCKRCEDAVQGGPILS